MRLASSALLALVLAFAAPGARAGEVFAVAGGTNDLYVINTATFGVSLVGTFKPPPGEFGIPALALDSDTSNLYGLSAAFFSGTLVQLDTVTAEATALFPLNGPTGPLGSAYDVTTDRVWWINTGGFFPAPQVYFAEPLTGNVGSTGNIGDFSQWFSGMTMTPDGSMWALETGTSSLYLIDENNPFGAGSIAVAPLSANFDLSQGGALAVDGPASSGLLAYSVAQHALFRLDVTNGVATLVHTFPTTVPSFMTLAGSSCKGFAIRYGKGCPGTGGFVPLLKLDGCAAPGSIVDLEISSGLGGANSIVFFGAAPASLPLGMGCRLLAFPLFPLTLTLPLAAGGPGAGAVSVQLAVPLTIPNGTQFAMQAFVIDGGAPLGASNSNGVEVKIDS